jgi:glycosyltransferase involved in cell wall biosynthesis
MPEISVVVPVYNAAAFLDECVRSVLDQTFRDLELILVDDGSTDSSPAICDRYAAQDGRVRVVHLPNGGVSAARNHGLELATGRFVQFVDSDDSIRPEMLERMHAEAVESGCDVVICGIERHSARHSVHASPGDHRCASREEFAKVAVELARTSLLYNPVNKLIPKRILESTGARFPLSMSIGEDLMFCMRVLKGCVRISCLKDSHYRYRIHSGETLSFRYHRNGVEAFKAHYREVSSYFDLLGVQGGERSVVPRRFVFDSYRQIALTFREEGRAKAGELLRAFVRDPDFVDASKACARWSPRLIALRSGSAMLVSLAFQTEMRIKATLGW